MKSINLKTVWIK